MITLSAKIVDPGRYKKTTREKSSKVKEARRQELKKQEKLKKKIRENRINRSSNSSYSYIKINDKSETKKINKKNNLNYRSRNKNKKTSISVTKVLKIAVLLTIVISISLLSKNIVNKYLTKDIATTVELDTGEVVSLVQDSSLVIGMSKLDTTDLSKTRNIVLNEIYNLCNLKLIDFDSEYNINYIVASEIEKISNKEYLITLNEEYDVTVEDIIKSVQIIKDTGTENIYYNSVNKIYNISTIDKNIIKITLTEELPYFVYCLNFPIYKEDTKKQEYVLLSNLGNEIKFCRNNSNSTIKDITFRNYDDTYNMVDDFRNKKVDIFTASSDSIMSLIGKYDYSVKKYRDGETLFLLGNSGSKLFSMKEVRKAILYCINRDKIIDDVNSTFLEKIDIPYIYSDIKYKYDIYGAQNSLQSQGWQNKDGLYRKVIENEEINLEISLLVNSNDSKKIKVAEILKEMLEQNSIRVNIKALANQDFNNALNNKEYDLLLADVYINSIPDITFIESYLNINETITSAINIVKNSTIDELQKNILSLQEVLSNEVACIGIYATNTNVVYQTDIAGISGPKYMNIFNKFESIGKIQNTNQ